MRILILITIIIGSLSCKQNTEAKVSEEKSETTKNTEQPTSFGEDFEASNILSYDSMLQQIAEKDSLVDIVVKGKVDGVCQVKGCWMNIVSSNDSLAESMFVKFHDYGFFMPLDLTGDVIMKGKAYYEETTVDELRHYAEDEGKSEEEIAAIVEPIKELKFMATGVQIAE